MPRVINMKKKFLNLTINKFLYNFKNNEDGAIIIIIAISMVAILSMAALTIDIGSAYLTAGKIQRAIDAAAYSAGRMMPVSSNSASAIANIKDSAINYASLNGYSELTRSNVVLENVSNGNYTTMKIIVTKNLETTFARVLGINSIDISKTSKIILSPTFKSNNLTPLGISASELSERLANNQYTHIVLKYGKRDSERGFFGALDLDGQGGGASDYRKWLAQGYPGETVVGDILLKENGNMVGPTYQGFTTRYDGCTHYGATTGGTGCTSEHFDRDCPRIAKVVIYDPNTFFTVKVVGFAAFLLEAQSSQGEIQGTFLHTINTAGQGSGGLAGTDFDYGLYSLMLSQ